MKRKFKLFDVITYTCVFITLAIFIFLILHIIKRAYPAFNQLGIVNLLNIDGEWRPVSKTPKYSFLTALLGTLYVSSVGVFLAMLFGICCSVFLCFYVDKKTSKFIQSFINMLAGVPSVIFGFFGLRVVVKFFQENANLSSGHCVLAASIILSVMLLPFTVSTLIESIEIIRHKYENITKSLGVSKESFIVDILFLSMKRGLITATILAFGRALGETMAVMMLIGNSNIFPKMLGRGQTIPALTAMELSSVAYGSMHLSAIYAANAVLLSILIVLFGVGNYIKRGEMNEQKS